MNRDERLEYMKLLYSEGFTYDEIGKKVGVSKQRVFQLIGKNNPNLFKPVTEKVCAFPALRNWMNSNKVNVSELTRRMYGQCAPASHSRVKAKINGTVEMKKSFIDKILTITQLSYEQIFKSEV